MIAAQRDAVMIDPAEAERCAHSAVDATGSACAIVRFAIRICLVESCVRSVLRVIAVDIIARMMMSVIMRGDCM